MLRIFEQSEFQPFCNAGFTQASTERVVSKSISIYCHFLSFSPLALSFFIHHQIFYVKILGMPGNEPGTARSERISVNLCAKLPPDA